MQMAQTAREPATVRGFFMFHASREAHGLAAAVKNPGRRVVPAGNRWPGGLTDWECETRNRPVSALNRRFVAVVGGQVVATDG